MLYSISEYLLLLLAVSDAVANTTSVPRNLEYETRANLTVDPGDSCEENTIPLNKNKCCSRYRKNYRRKWYSEGLYLTTYLSTLQFWNCTEFVEECKDRVYDFTPFTRLVYQRFCVPRSWRQTCARKLLKIVTSEEIGPEVNDTRDAMLAADDDAWRNLIDSLNPLTMGHCDLNKPCVQVALFDRSTGGVGRFHEIVEPFVPFCEMVWVGYDIDTTMHGYVAPWTSISLRCRASIIICMLVTGIIGLAIIIGNSIVIAVYASIAMLRNSQAIYKLSIAIGDLLVGLVVFPNILLFQYWVYFSPRRMGDKMEDDASTINATSQGFEIRKSGYGNGFLKQEHIMFVGFMTTLSLTVSVYTLLFASFDRLMAVNRPLKYRKNAAKRYAKYSCTAIWISAALVGFIPIIIDSLTYKLVAVTIVTSEGENALIFLAVAFIVPVLVLWAVNIVTYRSAMKHAKNRRRLTNSVSPYNIEKQLSRTLRLMVGIFSGCTIPVIVVLTLVHFLPGVSYGHPKLLDPDSAMIYSSFEYCTALVLLTNSLWNCFIYSARVKDFRKAAGITCGVLAKRSGFRHVSRGASFVFSSARRASLATFNSSARRSTTSSEFGLTKGTSGNATALDRPGRASQATLNCPGRRSTTTSELGATKVMSISANVPGETNPSPSPPTKLASTFITRYSPSISRGAVTTTAAVYDRMGKGTPTKLQRTRSLKSMSQATSDGLVASVMENIDECGQ